MRAPAQIDDLCFTPAVVLRDLTRRRELSPVEIVEAYLHRIERVDPQVNAFVTVTGEEALEHARRAERDLGKDGAEELGPLHGLPVTVKDLTSTAGVRTTFGSRHFAGNVPDTDGLIWARLKAAGAILLGKTTTPEFGEHSITESPLTGITNNPWDLERTVGGSSGGAGAAVAAGMGALATGSDGGGSIRCPASFCGVVGLKPSRGRIPIWSEQPVFDDVDVVGPMTRSVADCALMLSVVAGPHPYDPYSLLDSGTDYLALLEDASVDRLRVAFSPDLGDPPVEPAVATTVASAAAAFAELGAEVETVEMVLPDPIDYAIRWWAPAIALEFEEKVTDAGLDEGASHPEMLRIRQLAAELSAIDHVRQALTERERIHRAFADVYADHDLLIYPTTAMVAFPHPGPEGGPLEVAGVPSRNPMWENQRFTEAVSHAGFPAVTVPCGFTEEGLPVGLQITAGHGRDDTVLRAAAAFEAARPWADRRPSL